MYVLWRVIVKELLQLGRDRKMLPMIFVAPIVQIVIFGFAVDTDVRLVPMVLVDQDGTAASRELVHRFSGSGYFRLEGSEASVGGVERWLEAGRAQLALVIGPGYGEQLARGGRPRVQAIVDGTDANSGTVAMGYAASIVAGKGREVVLQKRGGRTPPVPYAVPRVWYNPDLESRWFYVPAVLGMILMMMTMLLSSMGVVREKEIGTMEQIIVTPIRPWQLIVGKLFPFAAIGIVQVVLVTVVAVQGFGVPLRGSFLLLLALTQLLFLNTLGLGLLVSTLVSNQQQAMMMSAFCLMVPMIYLSGLLFPIENMPAAIRPFTWVIPLRHYAEILRGIFLRGSGLDVLWPQAAALAGLGVAILAVAVGRFQKTLD
ncbi:MAG: ABC transporter permease [Candidatus Wallbacteria bacterium]|nr:ABC transporter permease [Candidatus Wallbacteria bacterium]